MERMLEWAKILIVGFVLHRTFNFAIQSDGIPLFGFLEAEFFRTSRWILSASILVLWVSRVRDDRYLYLLSILNLIFQFTLSYSTVGAFSIAPIFLFAYAYDLTSRSGVRADRQAAWLLAGIFLAAAVHKLNSSYLEGVEFQSGGSFVSYLEYWVPSAMGLISPAIAGTLAKASVVLELVTAIGLLVRPSIFGVVALYFVLILAIIHPPVLFVYFFLLPLVMALLPQLNSLLPETRPWIRYVGPVMTALLLAGIAADSTSLGRPPYVSIGITIVLLIAQTWALLRIGGRHQQSRPLRFFVPPWSKALAHLLLAISFFGSFYFFPSPIGFSMFSGSRFRTGVFVLEVAGEKACQSAKRLWRFSLASDSDVKFIDDLRCEIRFPTCSGTKLIQEKLCRLDPDVVIRLAPSSECSLEETKCGGTGNI